MGAGISGCSPRMSPAQCRAARGLLDWSQAKLAEKAHLGRPSVAQFEQSKRQSARETLADIETAFRLAGVLFTYGSDEFPNGRGASLMDPPVALPRRRPGRPRINNLPILLVDK